MFGLSTRRRQILRWAKRRNYTIWLYVIGLLLPLFVIFAIYDFVQTAKAKEELIQTAGLNSELAQFVLALREDDGYPLIENAEALSKASRPLSPITFRKQFFSYFLNNKNLRSFNVKEIHWEMPRSCTLEFSPRRNKSKDLISQKLKACLATVQDDQNGRYLYFSFKYPTNFVHRHIPGKPIINSDFINIAFKGERYLNINLVFHQPSFSLTKAQLKQSRFNGIYELTAYSPEEINSPIRGVNAQAFEQVLQDTAQNYITVLGRIDASLLYPYSNTNKRWPSEAIKKLKTSLSINEYDEDSGKLIKKFDVPFETKGIGLVSLEQSYLSLIQSNSSLEIKAQNNQLLWKSDSISHRAKKTSGFFQSISDWWAKEILSLAGYNESKTTIHRKIFDPELVELSITAGRGTVPDIATRSFLWLWLALALALGFGYVFSKALSQLNHITEIAYRMASKPTSNNDLQSYASREDEIGVLGRTFNLLFRRSRLRDTQLIERIKREHHERNETIRAVQEQVKARQAVLDAIGHEIKAPLQILLLKIPKESDFRDEIVRMQRAVDALYQATSVEAGLQTGKTVLQEMDIAKYLKRFTENLIEIGHTVKYLGSEDSVFAIYDQIQLIPVLEHLIDNAFRHKQKGTSVEISLRADNEVVTIEVFNFGSQIADDQLESIFKYGVSSHLRPENKGIGLFSARSNIAGMRGSIAAINRSNGVAFVVSLPSVLKEEKQLQ